MYCELIDSLFITRLIVSANISAMLSCFTFAHFLAYGMLSVNTISVSPDSCTRKEAGSDITQWLAIARTDLAPASIMILAALVIVPAVSTISSINTTFLSFTSPMICTQTRFRDSSISPKTTCMHQPYSSLISSH